MKLLVVSDSHGNKSILKDLKEKYNTIVDAMIHCGDSELQADDGVLEDYSTVAGNCDLDARLPEQHVMNVGDSVIFVAHGHRHNIKSTLMNIAYAAREYQADFVFFGHSHLYGAEMVDGTLYLNPGSVLLPRGGNDQSYALVIKQESDIIVRFYNLQHQLLDEHLFHK